MTDDLGAAIEAGARALDNHTESVHGFVLCFEDRDGYARAVIEAALPALLAAGWTPPDALEQVGWCWSEEGHGHPAEYFPYEFTACRMQLTDPDGQADDIPVYRLAAGWRPPDE